MHIFSLTPSLAVGLTAKRVDDDTVTIAPQALRCPKLCESRAGGCPGGKSINCGALLERGLVEGEQGVKCRGPNEDACR